MRLQAEVVCIVLISFCMTVAAGYLWGYSVGAYEQRCYVTESE